MIDKMWAILTAICLKSGFSIAGVQHNANPGIENELVWREGSGSRDRPLAPPIFPSAPQEQLPAQEELTSAKCEQLAPRLLYQLSVFVQESFGSEFRRVIPNWLIMTDSILIDQRHCVLCPYNKLCIGKISVVVSILNLNLALFSSGLNPGIGSWNKGMILGPLFF
jgi:hypothetical protein